MNRFKLTPFRPGRVIRASEFQVRFSRSLIKLATGGDWANTQAEQTRRNLVWFWFDGLFASASDNIVNTYLVIYLLALGATQGHIGLLSSLSSLSAALMLLPGALLVERFGRRRTIVLVCGGAARLALLLLALTPLINGGPAAVTLALGLSVIRDASVNLSYPGWISLTADVVPIEGRGRYFASRNFIMSLMGMLMTFLVGLLITYTAQPSGYQIALGLAFVLGVGAVFSFGHLADQGIVKNAVAQPGLPVQTAAGTGEREAAQDADGAAQSGAAQSGDRPALTKGKGLAPWASLREMMKELGAHREFTAFAGITALWNFSLNIAGPFFNVYLVQNLHADAAMVGITSIASSLAGMLVQRKMGDLNDRWGARKLTVISGLLIPVVPLAWVFIDSPLYVIPINLASGALWGAYGMGSFNYLLSVTPADRMPRYSALFQIVVTASLAVGAALGSLIAAQWGIVTTFALSALGRLVTAGLFAVLSGRQREAVQQGRAAAAGNH